VKFTPNRRGSRAVAPFYGFAVPAKMNICKTNACSPDDLERDII
jgi:hypothetical protein